MGTSLPSLVHCSATQVQYGKALASRLPETVGGRCMQGGQWWSSMRFVCFSEEHPCVFSLLPLPVISLFKDFMYTAFMLFCLMKIVWICAFQTVKKEIPFSSLRWSVCYVTPPKIDLDFSKVCSSQCCLPVSMHDRLSSYFQSLR